MDGDVIHALARRLILDGYVDNEPDALLAAIDILTTAERLPDRAGHTQDSEVSR